MNLDVSAYADAHCRKTRTRAVESFPSTTENLPCGTDATSNEGWLDLKVRNLTNCAFQIVIRFDDDYMYGFIRSGREIGFNYTIVNPKVTYYCEIGYDLPDEIISEEKGE